MNASALVQSMENSLGQHIPHLLGALAILLIGWFIAVIVRAGVRRSLAFLGLNQRFSSLTGQTLNLESLIAVAFFWAVLLLTLAGVFNSLDLVARVDAAALVRHARALGNATAAGALGSWLEREQKRLGVPDAALEELRTLAPSQARYALGTKSGEGRTAKGWNVILPVDVVERRIASCPVPNRPAHLQRARHRDLRVLRFGRRRTGRFVGRPDHHHSTTFGTSQDLANGRLVTDLEPRFARRAGDGE